MVTRTGRSRSSMESSSRNAKLLHTDRFLDRDHLPVASGDHALTGLRRRTLEPVEARLDHVVLQPHDALRARDTRELRKPRHRDGVVTLHPVAMLRIDGHLVRIAAGILRGQRVEFRLPFRRDLVAAEGRVLASHEDGEGKVAKVVRLRLVRMAGHHACGSEAIGHARAQLVHAVSARAVAHEVDAIGIHAVHQHHVLDQTIDERIHVRLMPQVPGVGGSSRRHIHPLFGRVQALLIAPLLIVHLRGCAAAAMQADPEASTARRRLTADGEPDRHAHFTDRDHTGLELFTRGSEALRATRSHGLRKWRRFAQGRGRGCPKQQQHENEKQRAHRAAV